MKRIKFFLGIGFRNANQEEIMEFEDDATDEEIDETFEDWKSNYIDASWWNADE